MRGIVLAGGLGSRLFPLTKVTNKHLLPVYDRPMVFYPIECLKNAGVVDVLLVTGGTSAGDFMRLLGDGRDFGLRSITYAYQEGEGGIADALRLAEPFAAGERIIVVLGDNIIQGNVRASAEAFARQPRGARIVIKRVPDPERFGVPVFDGERIVGIEEKPQQPRSPYAVTGIYFYDNHVFELIRGLKPSARGEYEISDVNNAYLARDALCHDVLEGWWTDAGTFESLLRAGRLVAETGANHVDGPLDGHGESE
ncbi:MAG: NTP transferase domain-containing protein [Acidobacteriota bacterium]|nr:MAG: NTP transferase domain-containing protein [Acidobacteriota bacterium]